jgi:hypothetical protein
MVIKQNCLKSSGLPGMKKKSPIRVFKSGQKYSLQIQPFICIKEYSLHAGHERGKIKRAPCFRIRSQGTGFDPVPRPWN